jgi:hypothetical protein
VIVSDRVRLFKFIYADASPFADPVALVTIPANPYTQSGVSVHPGGVAA